MYARHIIAQMAGFEKWTEMFKASDVELQLAKLLFDNMHKINPEEWQMYLAQQERDNDITFDAETRLEIFTVVFANVDGHESMFADYRLAKSKEGRLKIKQTTRRKRSLQPKSFPYR